MRTPLTRPVLAALLAGCLLAGCGDDPGDTGDGEVAAADLTETTTPEALAAAVLTHVDVDPLSIEVVEVDADDPDAPDDAVAISMRLPLTPDDDQGALLRVGTTADPLGDAGCGQDDNEDGCTDDELDGGGRLLTSWQAEEPEEDPGIVTIAAERTEPASSTYLYLGGPTIPEDLTDDTDLELFTLGGLEDIALDPTVGPTTTPELLAAGEDLPDEWFVEPGTEG